MRASEMPLVIIVDVATLFVSARVENGIPLCGDCDDFDEIAEPSQLAKRRSGRVREGSCGPSTARRSRSISRALALRESCSA